MKVNLSCNTLCTSTRTTPQVYNSPRDNITHEGNSLPGQFPTRKTHLQDRPGVVLMRIYIVTGGELSWWRVVLVESCRSGELSWWGVVVVVESCPGGHCQLVVLGSHPGWEIFVWGIVLVGSSPGGELSWHGVVWVGVVQWGVVLEPLHKSPGMDLPEATRLQCNSHTFR